MAARDRDDERHWHDDDRDAEALEASKASGYTPGVPTEVGYRAADDVAKNAGSGASGPDDIGTGADAVAPDPFHPLGGRDVQAGEDWSNPVKKDERSSE